MIKKLALTIPGYGEVSTPPGVSSGGYNTTGIGVIQTVISWLIIIAILLCLIYLIWGGWDWITSTGDKQKVDRARQKLVFAVIGLVLVLMSFLAMQIILNFFLGTSTCGVPRPGLPPIPC